MDTCYMCRWIPVTVTVTVITACGFQSGVSPEQGDAAIAADGVMNTNDNVVHVGSGDEYTGMGDLTIAAPITIDSGRMAFGMLLPPGVTFTPAKQDGGGPDLAILHVRKLDMHATVRVVGPRPLVVIADSFELTETINVPASCNTPATPAPGLGSGAIELYARTRILISGYINTNADGPGGPGGPGGGIGGDGGDGGDGCQGDSLGTITLQSPSIENSGRLSTNGGGGARADGGNPGPILMLYKTRVLPGTTTPTAITQLY